MQNENHSFNETIAHMRSLGMTIVVQGQPCSKCSTPLEDGECIYCANLSPVKRAIKCLFTPGQIVELRAIRHDGSVWSGLYTDHDELAADVSGISADNTYKSIYYTLNPIKQSWLNSGEMAHNGYRRAKRATKDSDIERRRWLLLDFDPVRPSNTSSTDSELAAAKKVMEEVYEYLTCEKNWPYPHIARSGNGYHLLFRIDIENTRVNDCTIEYVLKALDQRFSTERVTVDTAVGNAARICKSYGSIARKGTNDGGRPWRDSAIENPSQEVDTVSLAQLEDVAKKYEQYKTPSESEPSGLHEDFDVEEFMEHFELGYKGCEEKDGKLYYHLDSCPFKGGPHSGTAVKSSLIVGNSLGYHCFSDDCAGRGIGDLMRVLGEEHGSYPGVIWEGDTETESYDESIYEEEVPVIPVEHAPAVVAPPVTNLSAEDYTDIPGDTYTQAVYPNGVPERKPYVSPVNIDTSRYKLPEEALYGWLGQKTRTLDAPMCLAYPAMLTAWAGQGINEHLTTHEVRPTLFTVVVAPPGSGKSVTINRAMMTIPPTNPKLRKTTIPGSDRGLFKVFPMPKDGDSTFAPTGLLALDEIKGLLGKMNVPNSSLSSLLCILYYNNEQDSTDKVGNHGISVKLNLIGALPAEDEAQFAEYFGSDTTAGLYSRFIVAPGPSSWDWDFRWRAKPELRTPSKVYVSDTAHEMGSAWEREGRAQGKKTRGRLREMAMRVAVISASANGDTEITQECMIAALKFAEWQEGIKERFGAGVAETAEGKITSAIFDTFEGLRDENGVSTWIKFWPLAQSKNWTRKFGSSNVTRTKDSLIKDGTLIPELVDDEDDYTKASNQTGYFRLRNAKGVSIPGSPLLEPKQAAKEAKKTTKKRKS